jgi:DNA-binding NarL/FixJ family response regulator
MRVVLVGRVRDRDRVRPQLLAAGIDIVIEAAALPAAAELPEDLDAVVMATTDPSSPFATRSLEPTELTEALTAREQEVLELVAEGLSNKAMAAALGISDQTVKFHVAAIIAKLGATNRTDAVRRAVRRGLIAL